MVEYAIRTQNLTYDIASVRAVNNVTFDVPAGIVFGVLGPNGAGKSTLIHLLLGLVSPSKGSATVLGLDAQKHGEEIRRRTGVLLESNELFDQLSAEENLYYSARIQEMDDVERADRAQELLTSMGLWKRRCEKVGAWSRGMKRKLAIAKVLMTRPELFIFDEPTAGLDTAAAHDLYDEFLDIAALEGVTVFMTTHRIAEVEQFCSMVGLIRQGEMLAVGPTAELATLGSMTTLEIIGSGFTDNMIALLQRRREVNTIQAHHGRLLVKLNDSGAHTSPLINLLVESGADIEEVHKGRLGLESLFMNLVANGQTRDAATPASISGSMPKAT